MTKLSLRGEVEPAEDAEPSVDELLARAFGGRG